MTTRINITGLGDVAPEAHWPQTRLKSVAQGASSVGQIVLRDLGQDAREFVTGKRIEVDRGPGTDNIWGGYLMRANRRFWFSVDDPDELQRQWVLTVVDNNILFNKRVVFKVSSPATIEGPIYNTDVWDDDVIADLVADWLDLSADGIDTTTRVERVAKSNAGQRFYPISGGMRWGQSMEIISWLPNAVWYLDPDWKLVYVDVDDEDAPFELSDEPTPAQASYRECVILNDGAQLANDILGWGFGKGVNHGVFERVTDATSVELHGLWQDGFVAYDVWKQTTIDRYVDSAINGSPSSKRGRKNDRFEVNLVTYDHGFRVGQRPRFINNVWSVDDVIPIREMEISWVTQDDIRYQMKLTHEIDRQWTMFDPLPRIKIPDPKEPEIKIEIPTDEDCPKGICGITDTFDRTVIDGWGKSSSGRTWAFERPDGATNADHDPFAVSGGVATISPGSTSGDPFIALPVVLSAGTIITTFDMLLTPIDGTCEPRFYFATGTGEIYGFSVLHDESGPTTTIRVVSNADEDEEEYTGSFDVDEWLHVKVRLAGQLVSVKIWTVGDDEPQYYMISSGDEEEPDPLALVAYFEDYDHSTLSVRDLDITGINACTAVQTDDFDRTESTGFLLATNGELWDEQANDAVTERTVEGSYGRLWIQAEETDDGDGWNQLAPFLPPSISSSLDISGFVGPSFYAHWMMSFRSMDTPHSGTPEAAIVLRLRGATGESSVSLRDEGPHVIDGATILTLSADGVVPSSMDFDVNAFHPISLTVVWYHVELIQTWPNSLELRIWDRDEPRPSSPTLEVDLTGADAWSGQRKFAIDMQQAGAHSGDNPSGGAFEVWLTDVDFDYDGRPCIVEECIEIESEELCGPIEAKPVVPVSGEVVEDHRTTANWFRTGAPFVPGSPTVWVDGLHQTDYHTYPADGVIVMNFTVDGPTHYRVRYTVA